MKILLIVFTFMMVLSSCNGLSYRDLCSFSIGEYQLHFEEIVNSSPFPAPYAEAKIKVKVKDKKTLYYSSPVIQINNDGKRLECSRNIKLIDTESAFARFTIEGEEHELERYIIIIGEDGVFSLEGENRKSGVPPWE